MVGENILIVEDDALVAESLSLHLHDAGYNVVDVLPTADVALQVLKGVKVELVLMDIILEGEMDGIQAANVIRHDYSLPVVFITAHANTDLLERAKMAEPYGYLLKPVNVQELTTTIEIALYRDGLARELRDSHHWARAVLHAIGDGVITTDVQGVVNYMNPVAEKLVGRSLQEAQGQLLCDVFEVTDPVTGKVLDDPVLMMQKGEFHKVSGSHILNTANGFPIAVDDALTVIKNPAGEFQGLVATFRDVSVRMRLEEERSAVMSQMEQEIEARAGWLADVNQALTHELAHRREMEKRLESALQMADDASNAKNGFIANISHELRTPMNAILGFTSLLQKSPDMGNKSQLMLEHMNKAGLQLLRLIDDLLDLSRIEHGTLEIINSPFMLDALCQEVLVVAQASADDRGLRLKHERCDKGFNYFTGDAGRIRQVLQNLLDNAIKFTHEGEVLLAVECTTTSDSVVHVRFTVRDTGIGIPVEFHERLFERFTQQDESNARKYGGVGVGLAICRHIVNSMDGSIGLTSLAGQGSEFWVELPLRLATPSDVLPSDRQAEGGDMGKTRVLLVEDNRLNQITLKAMVEEAGCHVDVAGTGKDALEKLEQPYDLVLMDISMPDMDGYQTTAEIRRLFSQRGHLPVVALTAHAMQGERERCIAAGMDDYLSKPVQMASLHAAIRRWTQKEPADSA